MLKKLFPICEVVTPNSHTFTQRRLIGLHNGLIVQFIQPLVNCTSNIFTVIISRMENLETRVRFGSNFLEKYSLRNLALLNCVLFGGADYGYACLILDEVSDSFNYGFLGAHHDKVEFVFVCLCELADFVYVEGWYDYVFCGVFSVVGVALFVGDVEFHLVFFAS